MTDQPPSPEPQSNEAQKKCIEFWEEFKKQCKNIGMRPVPVTNLKLDVAESINQRERNLVQYVVNAYTNPQVVFQPAAQPKEEPAAKPEEPKKEEVNKK